MAGISLPLLGISHAMRIQEEDIKGIERALVVTNHNTVLNLYFNCPRINDLQVVSM